MRTAVAALLAAVTLSPGMSAPTYAATSIEGHGTYVNAQVTATPVSKANGVAVVRLHFTSTLTGILTGTCAVGGTEAVRADGSAAAWGTGWCRGTVAERQGVFLLRIRASFAADGSVQARFLLSGSGALASLHGLGTAQGTLAAGTNAFRLRFDERRHASRARGPAGPSA